MEEFERVVRDFTAVFLSGTFLFLLLRHYAINERGSYAIGGEITGYFIAILAYIVYRWVKSKISQKK